MKNNQNIWFCCATVSFHILNEWFPGDTGAYVNVVAQASDEAHFKTKIETALKQMDFALEACNELETFDEKIKHDAPDESILKLVEQAKESEEVFFGLFHTYEDEYTNADPDKSPDSL